MNLKRLLHSACSVLLVVAAVSCLSLRRSSDVIPLGSPAVLHPGDSIKVVVWRNAELSGAFLVADDGTIRHPLYQTIQVANTPLDSVTARLDAFLSQLTTTPHFVVEPKFRIVVRGEVRSPALYTVPLETTLGGAIAVAGGPTQEAQLRKVTLVRDQHSYLLDLSDPAAPWTASPIRSGDQIIIGRRSNVFFGTVLPLVTAGAALASLISVLRRY
ncbi:MAG TPA: polysaccharide biosynthesis/export family protein [Gemmatimonadaceae bacterium]